VFAPFPWGTFPWGWEAGPIMRVGRNVWPGPKLERHPWEFSIRGRRPFEKENKFYKRVVTIPFYNRGVVKVILGGRLAFDFCGRPTIHWSVRRVIILEYRWPHQPVEVLRLRPEHLNHHS
jgi:hypothetical protein